ncbi:MAG: cell surface protein SprA, partial [Saprospiraceae bacterium]
GIKPITPFKKAIKKDKYLKFITEFNFNPLPNTYGFNTNLERLEGITTYRFAGEDPALNTFYNRRFTWDRNYSLGWDLTKALRFKFDANARSLIDEPLEFDAEGKRYTRQERRDSIWQNFRRLGRPKNYTHTGSLNWTLPFKQIPFMDFINMKASYTAGYTWTAQSLKLQNLDAGPYQDIVNSRSLGNTIQNNNTTQIHGDFNFETLYNKSKYLAKINKPRVPGSSSGSRPGQPGGGNNKGDDNQPGGGRGKDGKNPIPGRGGNRPNAPGGGIDGGMMGGGNDGGKNNSVPDRNAPSQPTPNNPDKSANPGGGMNPVGMPLPGGIGGFDPASGRPGRQRANPSDPETPTPAGGEATDRGANAPGGKGNKGKSPKKGDRQPSLAERIALRPLMLVRKARFTYSENRSNVIPGFTPDTRLMGLSEGFEAPGWAFVAGIQPADRAYLDELGSAGYITHRPE